MAAATYSSYGRRKLTHPALGRTDHIQIGSLRFRYEDAASVSRYATRERDWDGQMFCSAVYGLASASFLIGILIGSLALRYLIAVVFLGAVSLMCIGDVWNTPSLTIHRISIRLRDGRTCEFVDADPNVVDAIHARFIAAGAIDV